MIAEPRLEAVVDLYPWKPSLALVRALEWRGAHAHRAALAPPVLDLGCGDGRIGHVFFGGRDRVGLDRDPAALAEGHGLMRCRVCGDARALPLRAGTFGTVFANCAIEHFDEIGRCLAECARVLRPRGVLLATVPSGAWKDLYVWNRVLGRLGLPRLGRRVVDAHDRRMRHVNLLSGERWGGLLRAAGLEPVAFDPYLPPAGALFVTLLESILSRPFPAPGFWKESGTYYVLIGVLRRLGGAALWKGLALRAIRPLYAQPVGPDGLAAGTLIVARRP